MNPLGFHLKQLTAGDQVQVIYEADEDARMTSWTCTPNKGAACVNLERQHPCRSRPFRGGPVSTGD